MVLSLFVSTWGWQEMWKVSNASAQPPTNSLPRLSDATPPINHPFMSHPSHPITPSLPLSLSPQHLTPSALSPSHLPCLTAHSLMFSPLSCPSSPLTTQRPHPLPQRTAASTLSPSRSSTPLSHLAAPLPITQLLQPQRTAASRSPTSVLPTCWQRPAPSQRWSWEHLTTCRSGEGG